MVMTLTSMYDIRALLNNRVQFGQTDISVASYHEQVSDILHDAMLKQICGAFYPGLDDSNYLATTSVRPRHNTRTWPVSLPAPRPTTFRQCTTSLYRIASTQLSLSYSPLGITPVAISANLSQSAKKVHVIPQQRLTKDSPYFLAFII